MRVALILDDDLKFWHTLLDYLACHGLEMTVRYCGGQSRGKARLARREIGPHDVTLPGIDRDLLQRVRAFSDVCVLSLTARGGSTGGVLVSGLGIDDCLPKQVDLEELVARIGAILHGKVSLLSTSGSPPKPSLHRAGFTIDFGSRTVLYGNRRLDLTDTEICLLERFLQSPGVVLTREELLSDVFQRRFHPLDRSLDVCVCRLRRKLRSATATGNHIKTVRNSGYLFHYAEQTSRQAEVS